MSGFNRVAFRREVAPQLKNKAFPVIARRVEGFFEREKGRMIDEFEAGGSGGGKNITAELSGSAPYKSAFLPQGNLHGLFGRILHILAILFYVSQLAQFSYFPPSITL
jgi:hypothetical protein